MRNSILPSQPPLTHLENVVHIGTLKPENKGCNGESLEGSGLSFSKHPEAWMAIARMGGLPWWEADVNAFRFLDGHQLLKTEKDALEHWGILHGWVKSSAAFIAKWMDEETNERMEMWFSTQEEAKEETISMGGDESEIELRTVCVPTKKLIVFMKYDIQKSEKITPTIHEELAIAWAHTVGLDGVWWADRLDVHALSAPRGVLFPEKAMMPDWKRIPAPHEKQQKRMKVMT